MSVQSKLIYTPLQHHLEPTVAFLRNAGLFNQSWPESTSTTILTMGHFALVSTTFPLWTSTTSTVLWYMELWKKESCDARPPPIIYKIMRSDLRGYILYLKSKREYIPYLKCFRVQRNSTILLRHNKPYKWVYRKPNRPVFCSKDFFLKVFVSEKGGGLWALLRHIISLLSCVALYCLFACLFTITIQFYK